MADRGSPPPAASARDLRQRLVSGIGSGSQWKRTVRPVLFGGLERALAATRDAGAREAIFRRMRRVDDRWDTYTRRFMRDVVDIEIGRYTYGAYRIDGSIVVGTTIGSFCSIAPGVRLGGSNHPLSWVSTHPFLYCENRGFVPRDDPWFVQEANAPVLIADDVWIGVNALVVPGVAIGRGAVVAAGAVVTRDVAPYAIVAGVPARVVRKRVDEERAERLLKIDWPRWSDETLLDRLDAFFDVDVFLDCFDRPESGGTGGGTSMGPESVGAGEPPAPPVAQNDPASR